MSRIDLCGIIQPQELLTDRVHQHVIRPTPEVCPADAVPEQGVPCKYPFTEMEAHASRCVAGCMNDPAFELSFSDLHPVFKEDINITHRRGGETKQVCLQVDLLVKEEVFPMDQDLCPGGILYVF